MRVLLILLMFLSGCASKPPVPSYWVPTPAPDGMVYELELLKDDIPGARAIMCAPVDESVYRCLYKRKADGAYGFVTIVVGS